MLNILKFVAIAAYLFNIILGMILINMLIRKQFIKGEDKNKILLFAILVLFISFIIVVLFAIFVNAIWIWILTDMSSIVMIILILFYLKFYHNYNFK